MQIWLLDPWKRSISSIDWSFSGPFLVLHVCLDMLCFCLLKIIAVATLFSQLLILKHFKKKHQKKLKNSWFSKKIRNRKKSQKIRKNRRKSRKIRKFSIWFSMEKFSKYFRNFRDFQKIWDFFDFGFCSKIKKISTFFDDFFLKCFIIKSWLNNVATAMLFNKQKHNISKQTCSTKKGL